MGLKVSLGSSRVCSVLGVVMVFGPKVEFHSSKLRDSKLWVKYTYRGIMYLMCKNNLILLCKLE